MARIIISKDTINLDSIMKGTITGLAANTVDLENVTKVSVGYKLVYVEYLDMNDTQCIRAYGRKEFSSLAIFNDTDLAILPLKGELFEKRTINFVKVEQEITPLNETIVEQETIIE